MSFPVNYYLFMRTDEKTLNNNFKERKRWAFWPTASSAKAYACAGPPPHPEPVQEWKLTMNPWARGTTSFQLSWMQCNSETYILETVVIISLVFQLWMVYVWQPMFRSKTWIWSSDFKVWCQAIWFLSKSRPLVPHLKRHVFWVDITFNCKLLFRPHLAAFLTSSASPSQARSRPMLSSPPPLPSFPPSFYK